MAAQTHPCPHCGQLLTPDADCPRCGPSTSAPTVRRTSPADPQAAPGPVAALPPLRVGEVLDGKWRLEGKLGAGGMGAVFLAHDLALDRKVAVKVLAAALCSDAEFVTRFEREARATARLEHPNVVPVYAVGRHQNRPFLVMKALEGVTLSKLLRDRLAAGQPMERSEVLALIKQLCAGLGFMHSRGYVHRDVKAGNVFMGSDGRVTVLDFGVLHDASASRITRSGVLLGTPTYVAPEQALGASEVDARADIYAVGVLLFECLTLRPPFSGDPVTLLKAHAEAPPPDPLSLAPDLPRAVGDVVLRALAKKPADRFQSAESLSLALEAAWPVPENEPTSSSERVAPKRKKLNLVPAEPSAGPDRATPAGEPQPKEPTQRTAVLEVLHPRTPSGMRKAFAAAPVPTIPAAGADALPDENLKTDLLDPSSMMDEPFDPGSDTAVRSKPTSRWVFVVAGAAVAAAAIALGVLVQRLLAP